MFDSWRSREKDFDKGCDKTCGKEEALIRYQREERESAGSKWGGGGMRPVAFRRGIGD